MRVLETRIREKTVEYDSLREQLAAADARHDELSRNLDQAREDRSFDRLKLDYQQIRARLRVAKHEYITLLLAQRLLEGMR